MPETSSENIAATVKPAVTTKSANILPLLAVVALGSMLVFGSAGFFFGRLGINNNQVTNNQPQITATPIVSLTETQTPTNASAETELARLERETSQLSMGTINAFTGEATLNVWGIPTYLKLKPSKIKMEAFTSVSSL